jgi:hypothetical protein
VALYQVVVEETEVKRTTVEVRAQDEAEAQDRGYAFVRDGMYADDVQSHVTEVVESEAEVQESKTELLDDEYDEEE